VEAETAALSDVLLVEVDGQRLGLPTELVHEVLPAASIAAAPRSLGFVEGFLNLRGNVLPVLSLRERLGREVRPPALEEHLVHVTCGEREVVLRVDRALDIVGVDRKRLRSVDGELGQFAGVAATSDGVLLIPDLDTFLNDDESGAIARSLPSRSSGG
jgi:chemotaxis signal transduction protein